MSRQSKKMTQRSMFEDIPDKLPEGDNEVEIKPATELMKKVAEATKSRGKMEKNFTPDEIQEILDKMQDEQEIDKGERQKLSKATRNNKKWVRNRSAGEYGKIYLYPSYTSKDGTVWHKMLDFSALYFVYVLAERMGMNVNIYTDKDTYIRASYVASVQDVEHVAEEFLRLGGKKVETTNTGIYILTLAEPMTADDFMGLVALENNRRDKMHNLFRPAAMAPATHKMLVDMVTQFGPKIDHLEKRHFFAFGENILRELEAVFRVYFMYSDGLMTRDETGRELVRHLNEIKAGIAVLSELNAWNSLATATLMGEALMLTREQVMRDFKLKLGKAENAEPRPESKR